MSAFEVVKPFNTPTRRFAAGVEIDENDDLSPHTIESLLTGKFIAGGKKTIAPPLVLPPAEADDK